MKNFDSYFKANPTGLGFKALHVRQWMVPHRGAKIARKTRRAAVNQLQFLILKDETATVMVVDSDEGRSKENNMTMINSQGRQWREEILIHRQSIGETKSKRRWWIDDVEQLSERGNVGRCSDWSVVAGMTKEAWMNVTFCGGGCWWYIQQLLLWRSPTHVDDSNWFFSSSLFFYFLFFCFLFLFLN